MTYIPTNLEGFDEYIDPSFVGYSHTDSCRITRRYGPDARASKIDILPLPPNDYMSAKGRLEPFCSCGLWNKLRDWHIESMQESGAMTADGFVADDDGVGE